jgi:hypothetical protein
MLRNKIPVDSTEVEKMMALFMEEGSFREVARQFRRSLPTVKKFAKEGNWKEVREKKQAHLDPGLELDRRGRERRHVELAKEIIANVRGRLRERSLKATARDAILAAELERKISGDDGDSAGKEGGPTFIFMKWDFLENVPKPKEIAVATEAVEVLPSEGA